jgi:hypothetical protein
MFNILFGKASKHEVFIVWVRTLLGLICILVGAIGVWVDDVFLARLGFLVGLFIYISMTVWQWSVRVEDVDKDGKNTE